MFKKILKCGIGFVILIALQFLCNLLIKTAHIAFPAPILGIIIFAFLLQINIIKKEWVKDICEFLLKIMPMLFVPLLVGIVVYYSVIEKNLIPVLINIIVTATLTILLTAITVDNIIKYVRLHHIRKLHDDE